MWIDKSGYKAYMESLKMENSDLKPILRECSARNIYVEESVANMLYEMDKQQLRYLLSVIEGLLTSHQTSK